MQSSYLSLPSSVSTNHFTLIIAYKKTESNAELSSTIRSILKQRDVSCEVIIAKHSSLIYSRTRSIPQFLFKVISNPDSGIGDAWNSALDEAHGEYVIFLGAGDLLYSKYTLFAAYNKILSLSLSGCSSSRPPVYYTLSELITPTGSKYTNPDINPARLRSCMCYAHASLIYPSALLKLFRFDPDFRISLDYEHTLRLARYVNLMPLYLPMSIVANNGLSSSNQHMLRIIFEDYRAKRKNKYFPFTGFILNSRRLLRFILKL